MRTTKYKDTIVKQDEFLFGICEIFEGAVDSMCTPEQTVDLAVLAGCKSMRVWMHHRDLFSVNAKGKPCFRADKLLFYKKLIARLIDGGIKHLVSMNHDYLHVPGFVPSDWNVLPDPAGEHYLPFMRLQREAYEMITREFPEIEYFEVGNEVNTDRFIARQGYGTKKDNSEFCFSDAEKAEVITDLCHYCYAGVKAGNKNALVVFPSPTLGVEKTEKFYEDVYRLIESGKFPRGEKPDTDADNYFQILSWHPYNFDGNNAALVRGCKQVYEAAVRHGDKGKKVFLTEFGYYDDDLVKFGLSVTEADIRQAAYLVGDFEAIRNELPFVETVHIFRLYDWFAGPGIEKTFGLFTTPRAKTGIIPKAKGLALYKYFRGARESVSPLYKFASINVQGDKDGKK